MAKYLHRSFDETYKDFELGISKGKKQDGVVCISDEEEEEEDINALNDETFGGEILGLSDDWEDEHEKFSGLHKSKDESTRSVHFQDDDDLETGRQIEENLSALVLDDEPYDDPAISYISRSKPIGVPNSHGFRRHSPVPQLQANESGSPQLTSIWSTSPLNDPSILSSKSLPNDVGHGKPKGMPNMRTLEDLEREMLGNTFPSKATPPSVTPPGHPPPHANLLRRLSGGPSPVRPQQFSPLRGDGFGSPPMFTRPPPAFIRVPPPRLHPPPPRPGFSPHKDLPLRGHPPNGIIRNFPREQSMRRQEHLRRRSSSEDEYAGLMTASEKNWLISIQLNQLHFDNPYIDDYYYTAYSMKKIAIEKNECRKGDDIPLMIPDRIKETKKYIPPQMENSLGRVQVVSVLAPRRIIDLNVMSASSSSKPREIPRYRQLLLEIESVYGTFLQIDDCGKRLAAAEGPQLQQVENEAKKLLYQLHQQLSSKEKLTQFLQVRKGKKLLIRLGHVLDDGDRRRVVQCLLCSFPVISKKDADGSLPNFDPLCEKALSTASLEQLCGMLETINKTALLALLGNKCGMRLLMMLLEYGEAAREKSKQEENAFREKWDCFLEQLGNALSQGSQLCKPEKSPEKPLKQICKRHPNLCQAFSRLK